jgi:hypothetical protein
MKKKVEPGPEPTPTTKEPRDTREGDKLESIVAEPKPDDAEYWKSYMRDLTEQRDRYNKEHRNDADFVPAA